MSARDEPSYLAFARAAVRHNESVSGTVAQELVARIDRDAAALKAAQPRTITTAAELDALPVGSIVAMIGSEPDSPAVACRAVRGWQFLGDDPERRYLSSSLMPSWEPITVLHEVTA